MTEINGSDILIFINGRIETECQLCESLFLAVNALQKCTYCAVEISFVLNYLQFAW